MMDLFGVLRWKMKRLGIEKAGGVVLSLASYSGSSQMSQIRWGPRRHFYLGFLHFSFASLLTAKIIGLEITACEISRGKSPKITKNDKGLSMCMFKI